MQNITPACVVAHARDLIAIEHDQAHRFAARFRNGETLLLTAIGIIDACRDRIRNYGEAFNSMLTAFGQTVLAAELQQHTDTVLDALNALPLDLMHSKLSEFDKFGQPHSGPVIGQEFKSLADQPAQSTLQDHAASALPIAAQARSVLSASPDHAPQRSDQRHPDRRSGTA